MSVDCPWPNASLCLAADVALARKGKGKRKLDMSLSAAGDADATKGTAESKDKSQDESGGRTLEVQDAAATTSEAQNAAGTSEAQNAAAAPVAKHRKTRVLAPQSAMHGKSDLSDEQREQIETLRTHIRITLETTEGCGTRGQMSVDNVVQKLNDYVTSIGHPELKHGHSRVSDDGCGGSVCGLGGLAADYGRDASRADCLVM